MTTYADIPDTELDIDKPVKSSTAKQQRDNPLAIMEGDPTAVAAGKGVNIDFDEGAGSQTAIKTDEIDTQKILVPDGFGSVKWSSERVGMFLIERKQIAGAVQNVTFSGLDGDADEVYKLIGRIIKPAGVAAYRFRPNGLTTNQSMGVTSNGTFALFGTLDFLTAVIAAGNIISFECLIHARETVEATGMDRQFIGKAMESGSALQVNDFGGVWGGAGNITSLLVSSSIASGIGIGSTFELFKLVQ